MNLKKKYIIKFSAYFSFAIIAVLFLVNVLLPQNIYASGFSMKYQSQGVSASVEAGYFVGNQKYKMKTTSGETFIEISADGSQSGEFLPNEEIVLDAKTASVVFEFKVTNTASDGKMLVSAFADALELENMNIDYAYSFEQTTNFDDVLFEQNFETKLLNANETIYVYARVMVADLANDASFNGSISVIFELG